MFIYRRVPAHRKGPLDTFWRIRDDQGYVLNNDGTRSSTVHQWDRWYGELIGFVKKISKKQKIPQINQTRDSATSDNITTNLL